MGFQISLCKFHKNCLSKRLLEGKAVTQKTSFPFLTEDISFSTIDHYGLPKTTLQIPQEQP
ncbi:unknown protein [Waddlia chondrophila 2032/99]|uniref:Uncharacterized protein n=1 Tax=Waddlia chondrophila 2032/99 TaxID=765953 RepID=F8LAC9_9BACT|nr:unknown protein [Waddlia chondrophila 2032/99]